MHCKLILASPILKNKRTFVLKIHLMFKFHITSKKISEPPTHLLLSYSNSLNTVYVNIITFIQFYVIRTVIHKFNMLSFGLLSIIHTNCTFRNQKFFGSIVLYHAIINFFTSVFSINMFSVLVFSDSLNRFFFLSSNLKKSYNAASCLKKKKKVDIRSDEY